LPSPGNQAHNKGNRIMTKINLNDATVTIISGEAGEITVDVAKLLESEAVVNYVFQYGLRQIIGDVHAGLTKKAESDDTLRRNGKRALIEKKLASLYAGEVAQARIGFGGDPVKREGMAMAERDLKAKLPAIGKKVGDFDKAVWRQLVEKQFAKGEAAYRKAAEAKLAIKPAAVAAMDVDDILAALEGATE
jgi:hypothetical protein